MVHRLKTVVINKKFLQTPQQRLFLCVWHANPVVAKN